VIVDPGAKVLLDDDLANNAVSLGPKKQPWRTIERTTYGAMLGLHALMP
jgi:hypothetical protein